MDMLTVLCVAGLVAGRITVYGESVFKQPAILVVTELCNFHLDKCLISCHYAVAW
jgi:hypothetical protein